MAVQLRFQKGLSILVVLVMIMAMAVTTVSAISGTAVINPIESNIAAKFWVTASADSGSATAAFSLDEDVSTAWIADDRSAGHWLQLDLGGAYDNLRKSEVVFADKNAAYQYKIEASTNGNDWEMIVDRTNNTVLKEGFVDLFTRPGIRTLRLTITGATPGATIGIRSLKVFNYLRENIVNGADMSYMDMYRNRNYYVNPNPQFIDMGAGPHVLDVVKDRGMKFIRLRIWNEPRSESTGALSNPPYNGPARSAVVATWVKDRDMKLGIDFHYADSWADPGKQPKPTAWAALPFDELVAAMHNFTYDYVKLLVDQGTTPDKVAVGNEIINGFLWGSESYEINPTNPAYVINNKALYWSQPGGGLLWKYWGTTDPAGQQKYDEAWDRFSTLVAAGIQAVREASPTTAVEIHVIVDQGKLAKTMEFWNQLLPRVNAKGANPDVLAISYYPQWHGTFQDLEMDLYTIAATFPQYRVEIAETAYPACCGSPLPNADQPLTVQGQANMIQRTIQAANDVIDNKGTGVLVWEPQSFQAMFTRVSGMFNYYQPYASIDVFNKSFAKHVLESRVYVTSFLNIPPALPETVNMLTMSDSTVNAVPVTWDAVDPNSYTKPGSFSVNGTTEYGTVSSQVTVIYNFQGFFAPVENLPAYNEVKAGSAIPLKFSLDGDYGLGVLAKGYPVSQQIGCELDAPISVIGETITSRANTLTYDPVTAQYLYVWKTDKSWLNTCRQLTVQLADGMEYRINLQIK